MANQIAQIAQEREELNMGGRGASSGNKRAAGAAGAPLTGVVKTSAAVASQLGAPAGASAKAPVPTGADFGRLAINAANSVPIAQRYGDRKTFVADAFETAKKASPNITIDEFKTKLIKAQRDGHVQLARADLIGAMDPRKVADSLIEENSGRITYHFIVNTDVK